MALTTIARCKAMLGISGTDFDTLLTTLVSEADARIISRIGRNVEEDDYTDYYDGTGNRFLWLRQGPLVSVDSVNYVEYTGTDSRSETLTEVEEGSRLEGGLASEGFRRNGWIEMISGKWTPGQRNIKVVYTAGWSTVPELLASHATASVVAAFLNRESVGLSSKTIGDANHSYLSPKQMYDAEERILAPYRSVPWLC